ncbi:MAG: diaminopimelate epimerase, partial [Candidatus Rokuibacteriota bacterium]
SPGARPSEWRMRTYERGVEAETLACGTGAVTAALAADGWGLGQLPATVITRLGQRLEVSGRRTNAGLYDELWLSGEARLVFRGVLT